MTSRAAGLGLAALLLLAAGVLLRTVALDLGWFGLDQARDVATALDVAAGRDAPVIGPTMRRVVRLGAAYYYFWAVPYVASQDPLAGYRFAAALSILAMLVVTALAQRLWGAGAALLTLAFAATHPVWVIDGRVAWAPAALPAVGAVLLWVLLSAPAAALSVRRATLAGALLGLAVQLHLTMVAWALAVALVVLFERPARRVVLAGVTGALVTGMPALVALVVGSAEEGGVGGLAGTSALDLGSRTRAMVSLGWRVPTALSQWPDVDTNGLWLAGAATTMVVLAACGLGSLVWRAPASRPARLLLSVTVISGGLVAALPGEGWWYYLDGLLPVLALAAGAVASSPPGGGVRPAVAAAVAAGLVASAVLAVQLAGFLVQVDRHGYLAVEPRLLTLDARPGDDAAAPGRMLAVRWQRAFAEYVAAEGGAFAPLWRRLHGPALGEVAGDNGFWLRWAVDAQVGRQVASDAQAAGRVASDATRRHFVVWYADAPLMPEPPGPEAAGDLEIATVGPLRVARQTPAIDYDSCRTVDGPVAVPIRLVPHPKRYGDGRPERPRDLPSRIDCTVRPGAGAARLMAHLDGPGTVRLIWRDSVSSAGTDTALCVARSSAPEPFTIELQLPPDAATALDLYDVPSAGCSPEGR